MRSIRLLFLYIIVLLTVGWLSGHLTQGSVDTWYLSLNRSSLTPANYVFGIVWSVLYCMIAIVGWWLWSNNSSVGLKILYVLQLILNFSWTPIFFYYNNVALALFCIFLLFLTLLVFVFKSYAQQRIAAIFMLPYLFWVGFASYLNLYIYIHNV